MSYPFDLGSYNRKVSTRIKAAQTWFNRGLAMCYGYNHDEAVRCFKAAVKTDPKCAMAQWGIAYAAGPNYNKQWKAFDLTDLARSLRLARKATLKAQVLARKAKPVEQALIVALLRRLNLWRDVPRPVLNRACRGGRDDRHATGAAAPH